MGKMKKFMVEHYNPGVDCNIIQDNWRKMAQLETATWIRTYINYDEGWRYCVWLAPDAEELKKIFREMDVSWEKIIPVEETTPDMWGEKWEEHLQKEQYADTLGF
ncbi:MAG: nickel-binding protein [Desulfosalsimonas sp.]